MLDSKSSELVTAPGVRIPPSPIFPLAKRAEKSPRRSLHSTPRTRTPLQGEGGRQRNSHPDVSLPIVPNRCESLPSRSLHSAPRTRTPLQGEGGRQRSSHHNVSLPIVPNRCESLPSRSLHSTPRTRTPLQGEGGRQRSSHPNVSLPIARIRHRCSRAGIRNPTWHRSPKAQLARNRF